MSLFFPPHLSNSLACIFIFHISPVFSYFACILIFRLYSHTSTVFPISYSHSHSSILFPRSFFELTRPTFTIISNPHFKHTHTHDAASSRAGSCRTRCMCIAREDPSYNTHDPQPCSQRCRRVQPRQDIRCARVRGKPTMAQTACPYRSWFVLCAWQGGLSIIGTGKLTAFVGKKINK